MRTIDLDSLEIFRTVVAEGGINRAAARLNRVQSNVTTRIRQLEERLGHKLSTARAALALRRRTRLLPYANGCCVSPTRPCSTAQRPPLGHSAWARSKARPAPGYRRCCRASTSASGRGGGTGLGHHGGTDQARERVRDRSRVRVRAVRRAGAGDHGGVRRGAGADHPAQRRLSHAAGGPGGRDADRLRARLLVPAAARAMARQGWCSAGALAGVRVVSGDDRLRGGRHGFRDRSGVGAEGFACHRCAATCAAGADPDEPHASRVARRAVGGAAESSGSAGARPSSSR